MDLGQEVYSVTELTRSIKQILEGSFPHLWVEGEISNFTCHSSGHMYFSLKDESSIIQAVFFRGANKDLKFEVKAGMQVLVFGRVSVYDKRGQYQFYVDKMEPKGAGALQLAFEQLKERLSKEGLFDASRKKTIPYLPGKIGVVTSPTGAVIKDILNVATRRFENAEIILYPVKVQGEGAKEEIASAIEALNEYGGLDVIIVARGGGSLEDLWPFNEEMVARAIYASRIPVISAVGHETDWTIADFVADMRAPTPSAAAELVLPREEELREKISASLNRLKNALVNVSVQGAQRTDELIERLEMSMEDVIDGKQEEFLSVTGKLEALGPLSVLRRGYSITELSGTGKVIRCAQDLKGNDRIRTIFSSGSVISRVEEIDPKKKNGSGGR